MPCSAVSMLLHVKPLGVCTNPPLELWNEATAIAIVGSDQAQGDVHAERHNPQPPQASRAAA